MNIERLPAFTVSRRVSTSLHSGISACRLSALLLLVALGSSGCRPQNDSANSQGDKISIGITQIATHSGIDAVRSGFIDEMARLGYREGEEVIYEITNALGDFSVAQGIAKRFASSDFDLIFSISTPSTQTLLEALQGNDTPLVFGAITDPVSAGIVESLDNPGKNVTGTADIWPVGEQFDLLTQLVPGVKRVGIIHNPAESNSQASVKLADAAAEERSLTLVKVPVSNSNEVPAAARSLVGRVDAIYIPADNTVISAIASVVAVSEQHGIPLLPGDTSNIEVGGFGTIGHDYYSVGAESARIAARILDGTPPSEIPVAVSPVREYFFNLRSAKATGVEIPQELLEKATQVYEE